MPCPCPRWWERPQPVARLNSGGIGAWTVPRTIDGRAVEGLDDLIRAKLADSGGSASKGGAAVNSIERDSACSKHRQRNTVHWC
jgi:hypothetical protein